MASSFASLRSRGGGKQCASVMVLLLVSRGGGRSCGRAADGLDGEIDIDRTGLLK